MEESFPQITEYIEYICIRLKTARYRLQNAVFYDFNYHMYYIQVWSFELSYDSSGPKFLYEHLAPRKLDYYVHTHLTT